jgi:glycosyltransferase involved in cell wall biosynthesis
MPLLLFDLNLPTSSDPQSLLPTPYSLLPPPSSLLMHILIVALHRPKEPTGVCRHAVNLARCLAEIDRIERITIVTGAWQQHYFQDYFGVDSPKIDFLGIDIKNTAISRNLWFLFALPKLVARLQPDLVHLSFPFPFIRPLFDRPVVLTLHDLYPYKIPENFGLKQAIFNRVFLWQCINSSDAIACVSHTTLQDLYRYFPAIGANPDRARVIYNFVDFCDRSTSIVDRIETEYPSELPANLTEPFILCVGQHRKNKNFDLAIGAYHRLLRAGRLPANWKLIIVGSKGPETANLLASIDRFGLTDAVITISAITDPALCWLYRHCQLVVIPSSLEGFCIPLVEALYFSCKVVCSDIPIFHEIAGDSCTYFKLEGEAIANLAQSIDTAFSTDLIPTTTRLDRFTKTAVAKQYWELYSSTIRLPKSKSTLPTQPRSSTSH